MFYEDAAIGCPVFLGMSVLRWFFLCPRSLEYTCLTEKQPIERDDCRLTAVKSPFIYGLLNHSVVLFLTLQTSLNELARTHDTLILVKYFGDIMRTERNSVLEIKPHV